MMKPARKLVTGLTAAAIIPLVATFFLLRPETDPGILLIICGILAVYTAWRLLESTLPATFSEWRRKQKNPDKFIDRLLNPIDEFINGLRESTLPEEDDELRHMLHDRLEELARRRHLLPAGGEVQEASILFSDLRGFTIITDTYSASEVIRMLNRYFTEMTEIIARYDGTVDKFIGDSIMALFIDSAERPKASERAVCCAAAMQIAMDEINEDNELQGMPKIYMGIGINTGRVVTGRVGSELHSEYTVIGQEVNLASRIEASTLRGQILLSENTFTQVEHIVRAKEPFSVTVKGKKDPLRLYELIAVDAPHNLVVPEREVRRYPRAVVDISFEYQLCEGKVVISDIHHGRIIDISAGGMRALTPTRLSPHLNIKFMLPAETVGIDTHDIYAKILKVNKEDDQYSLNLEFTIIDPKDIVAIKKLVARVSSVVIQRIP